MNRTTAASSPYEHAENWRQWQRGNVKSRRRDALHARLLFAVTVTATMVWLGLRALSWPV